MTAKWTVVLPTFNEKENVPLLVGEILKLPLSGLEILVVDDNSTDGTIENLREIFPEEKRLKIHQRKGKQRGLVNSLNDAIELCNSEYILWMDADLQMPANKIPEFIAQLESKKYTAVIGSRYLPGGDDIRDVKDQFGLVAVHKNLSWFLNRFAYQVLGLSATDLTSGFIGIRKDFFSGRKLQGNHGEYFIHLMYELHKTQAKFKEISYRLGPRKAGISKSTRGSFLGLFANGLNYLKMILKIYLKRAE
jgi:dolichol-phosphate mannosyltransferase